MSWGPATVYIQRRLNSDGTAVDSENPLQDVPDDDSYKEYPDDDEDEEEDEDEDEDGGDGGEALDNLD